MRSSLAGTGVHWGVPGYAATGTPQGVWFLQGATAHSIYPGQGGAGPLVVTGGGSGAPAPSSPHRATGRPTADPMGVVIAPATSGTGPG